MNTINSERNDSVITYEQLIKKGYTHIGAIKTLCEYRRKEKRKNMRALSPYDEHQLTYERNDPNEV